jgi:probable HAF family extracellular repeat protein
MFLNKFFAAISLLSVLLAPLHGQAAPLYTANFLPGVDFAPTGMNNAGQIVGFSGTGAGAILYRDGSVVDLGAGTAGYGINAHGDVVGSTQTAAGATGFIYTAGKLTALGNLGSGTQGIAVAVNDYGMVAGHSTISADPSTSPRHAFLYDGGKLHDLGGLDAWSISGVVAINNAGQVAGYMGEADAYTHAFLYEGGVMRDLGGLGGGPLEIHDLNVHGTLVGTAFDEDEGLIPFVRLGDRLADLNTLLDPALGWHIASAYANNDLGQIVGYGCQGAACGLVRLDLAGAVPEPEPASLLASGLLALGWVRGRLGRSNRTATNTRPASATMPAAPALSTAV